MQQCGIASGACNCRTGLESSLVRRRSLNTPAQRRVDAVVCAGPSPGRKGGGPGGNDSRLIIPGRDNGPSFGGRSGEGDARRLIIPGREGGGAAGPPNIRVPEGAGAGPSDGARMSKSFGNFRPPPGFMDKGPNPASLDGGGVDTSDTEAMLGKLKTGAGYWHELAKLLPALQRLGFDAQAVELATGLERPLQSVWAISEQVYESLKKAEEMPREKLRMLDAPGSEHLIYEMRFLALEARPPAALYILDNNLSPAEATVLSRAVKDHERRGAWKEGFTNHPGDCLAYKYYRDAIEARREKDKVAFVEKGLAVAVSESAQEQLRKLMGEEIPKVASASRALLQIVRLTKEEVGFRPVPMVAGSLETASRQDVVSTVHISQTGLFNTFTPVSDGKTSFVGLPAYNVLLFAARPVALLIDDCSKIDAIVDSVSAKTEEARKRLEGPGMLVVDREAGPVKDLEHYLVGTPGDRLQVVAGDQSPDEASICGRVLFCARPPRLRETDSGDAVVELR